MAESTEWLSKKLTPRQFFICNISENAGEQGKRQRPRRTCIPERSPVSNTKAAFFKGGLKWRRVQDSNLCIVIHDDGLAIRCITTLPTLRGTRVYVYYVLGDVNIFFHFI